MHRLREPEMAWFNVRPITAILPHLAVSKRRKILDYFISPAMMPGLPPATKSGRETEKSVIMRGMDAPWAYPRASGLSHGEFCANQPCILPRIAYYMNCRRSFHPWK
jgi:hypothetical protein